jgi:hypothetical protein
MASLLFDDNLIAVNPSRRTKRVPEIFAVLLQASRTIAIGVLLVGMSLAQQNSQEPAQPALRVQTDLVVVPFQVRRGSRSVSDLKPPDVVVLEDGVPRAFTGFEAPPDHPSLELVVMFDVTDVQRGGFGAPRPSMTWSATGTKRWPGHSLRNPERPSGSPCISSTNRGYGDCAALSAIPRSFSLRSVA